MESRERPIVILASSVSEDAEVKESALLPQLRNGSVVDPRANNANVMRTNAIRILMYDIGAITN
jgi:hypothetical protein